MKIIYIHQYFTTPDQPGGTRSYWISKELIKQGHEVTMLTTTRRRNDIKKREIIDGINVIYLNIEYNSKMGVIRRLLSFVQFMIISSLIVLREKKPDLVIATSTPLTVGFPALIGKKLKDIPYIFEVRDLWPEVPIQMGALKNKHAVKLAKWFERTIYKNAKHIVALSPGMSDGILAAGTPKEKITIIPNMSKIDKFWSRDKNKELIKELGLQQASFKIVYFGAMGFANGMEYIVEAAKLIMDEKEVEFVFLGGGSAETIIKEACNREDFSNMHFAGSASMERLSEIVNLCDVSLVTFSNLPILATNSPNKLFDSLSAGKPIIVNSPGWTKEMVETNECGLYVDPTNPKELAEKIIYLKNNPDLCKKMGLNSRKLAKEKYDKSILCNRFAELVDGLS